MLRRRHIHVGKGKQLQIVSPTTLSHKTKQLFFLAKGVACKTSLQRVDSRPLSTAWTLDPTTLQQYVRSTLLHCHGALTHITHIQFPVHISKNLLIAQCAPSQAERNRNGGIPTTGIVPMVTATRQKHTTPTLPRMRRWMKLNLLSASPGGRGGFWFSQTSTTGSVCAVLIVHRV